MALVSTMTELQSAIDALVSAGYDQAAFAGVTDFAEVEAALSDAGFVKVVNDAGASVGYQRLFTHTVAQTAAATTGESTSLIAAADISADFATGTGGASLAGLSGEAAGAVTLTPKTVLVCAAAGALGLTFGFDLGQAIVGAMTGSGFDWATESVGGKILTYLTGDGTTYVSENLVNNIKDWLIDNGYFSDGSYQPITSLTPPWSVMPVVSALNFAKEKAYSKDKQAVEVLLDSGVPDLGGFTFIEIGDYHDGFARIFTTADRGEYIKINRTVQQIQADTPPVSTGYYGTAGTTRYAAYIRGGSVSYKVKSVNTQGKTPVISPVTEGVWQDGYNFYYPSYGVMYCNLGTVQAAPSGVSKQTGATYPTKNDPVTTTYPTWDTQSKQVSRPTETDPNNKIKVLPIQLPVIDPKTGLQDQAQNQPTPVPDAEALIQTQPDVSTDSNIKLPQDVPTNDIGTTDPSTPVGDLAGVPTSGMVALYNPTLAQLRSFSQWLWSNDFIDNIKKIFQDPMSAIIGLHLIYATPSTSDTQTIITGYLDSNVPSKVVDNQYIVIDCGTITVNRYFGNVLDFNPYTKIQVYLPFIGVITIDTDDVIGRAVTIKYKIDVLTGTCLASIKISPTADDILRQKTLYSYAGNCAVQLPISGGSYAGIISNCIGVASSVAATMLSGGALAPAAVAGAVNAVTNSKLNVEHSGSLGSNAGSLGIKKPYLIITRPKPYAASSYQLYYGFPSNNLVQLGSCSGFCRCRDVKLTNIAATDDELVELVNLLSEGVYV